MAQYSVVAPDGHTYTVEGPEGATDEQVRTEVLRQNPQAAHQTAQPAQKGLLARGYDALGQVGADAAGRTHDLVAPVRAATTDRLSPASGDAREPGQFGAPVPLVPRSGLPVIGTILDAITGLTGGTREDAETSGRLLTRDMPVTAAPIGGGGAVGRALLQQILGRAGGPLTQYAAQTAGQIAGGAAGGAGVAEATGNDPLVGGLAGGALGAVPGVLSDKPWRIAGTGLKHLVTELPYIGKILKAIGGSAKKANRYPNQLEDEAAERLMRQNLPAGSVPPGSYGPRAVPGVSRFGGPTVDRAPSGPRSLPQEPAAVRPTSAPSSGMVTSTGQASAGVSGQGTSQLETILSKTRVKPTVRFGPGGMSPSGSPSPSGPVLPMTRPHVATGAPVGTPVGPLPQPPAAGMPPASPMADILRQDPTLRSALESFEWAKKMHQKGFRLGGKVR